MDLSPAPFLRIGFAILGLGLALGIWGENSAQFGGWTLAASIAAVLAVTSAGEVVVRRTAKLAEVRTPPRKTH